jgi:Fructose-bisphosphate aldolase class-II
VSIPDSKQYAQMLDAAAEGGYAYPAVNVSSSETLNAALRGFAEAESDGIVEVTTGGAAYVLRDAIRYGVVKVNVDTDMQFVFTRAIADHVRTHGVREKEQFDPRSWGRAAEAAMANAVAARCELLDSSAAPSHGRDCRVRCPYAVARPALAFMGTRRSPRLLGHLPYGSSDGPRPVGPLHLSAAGGIGGLTPRGASSQETRCSATWFRKASGSKAAAGPSAPARS